MSDVRQVIQPGMDINLGEKTKGIREAVLVELGEFLRKKLHDLNKGHIVRLEESEFLSKLLPVFLQYGNFTTDTGDKNASPAEAVNEQLDQSRSSEASIDNK